MCGLIPTAGSNPALSASFLYKSTTYKKFWFLTHIKTHKKVGVGAGLQIKPDPLQSTGSRDGVCWVAPFWGSHTAQTKPLEAAHSRSDTRTGGVTLRIGALVLICHYLLLEGKLACFSIAFLFSFLFEPDPAIGFDAPSTASSSSAVSP